MKDFIIFHEKMPNLWKFTFHIIIYFSPTRSDYIGILNELTQNYNKEVDNERIY